MSSPSSMTPLHLLLSGMQSHDRNKIREATAKIGTYLASDDPKRVPLQFPSHADTSRDNGSAGVNAKADADSDTDEVALIRRLLSFNCRLASTPSGRDDSLPLHLAAHLGNLRLCRVVCHAHPPAVVAPNKKGKIPLHFAARGGHVDIVRFFLRQNPDAASRASKKLKLPLHFSVSEGHVEISRLLLRAHPAGASSLSSKGKLPLHLASRWGHLEIVRTLLHYHPQGPRSLDWEGSLPLHDAALENHDEVVDVLVRSFPAGLRTCNIRGELPLSAAVRNNNAAMVHSMLRWYPEGGKLVLQNLNENDRVHCLHWQVLELCLRGATGMLQEQPPSRLAPYEPHDGRNTPCDVGSFFHHHRRRGGNAGGGFELDLAMPDFIRANGVGVHPMVAIPMNEGRTDVVLVHVQPWDMIEPHDGHHLPDHDSRPLPSRTVCEGPTWETNWHQYQHQAHFYPGHVVSYPSSAVERPYQSGGGSEIKNDCSSSSVVAIPASMPEDPSTSSESKPPVHAQNEKKRPRMAVVEMKTTEGGAPDSSNQQARPSISMMREPEACSTYSKRPRREQEAPPFLSSSCCTSSSCTAQFTNPPTVAGADGRDIRWAGPTASACHRPVDWHEGITWTDQWVAAAASRAVVPVAPRPFLPLHAAIKCGASLPVLRRVLRGWPEQVCMVDSNGRLPLHLVAASCRRRKGRGGSGSGSGSHSSSKTQFLIELLTAYAGGAHVRDGSNSLPLHVALTHRAQYGAVRALMDANMSSVCEVCGTLDGYRRAVPVVMAIGSGCDLEVIYCLLREDPNVVSEFVRLGGL